jgi:DNA repair exonuclease SbcCD ATPase subunit
MNMTIKNKISKKFQFKKLLVNKLLPVSILAISLNTSAGMLSDEQDRLSRYEQAYENHLVAVEDTENEIFGYSNKVTKAREDLVKAESELAKAAAALAGVRATALSAPGQDADRALKKATHSHKMALRGVRSRTKRLERVEGNLGDLNTQLTEQQESLVSDKRRITEQQERIVTVRANLKRKAKEKELAATKAEAKKAKQAQKLAKPVIAKPKPAPQPEVVPAPAPQVAAVPAKKELSELDKEALAFARKEVARLETLLADGSAGRPIFKRLVLKGNRTEPVSFEFLGQNQYRAEVVVTKGKQIFEIGKHKYRRTIPISDDGQTYVFIFDAKRPSRPRMVMFKKSLLDNI